MDAEHRRLEETRSKAAPWKKWGPYLSERQWGTVREDYSESGNAWDYFSHDQARSRAYRWGEDGLGGISDDRQLLCFALALWNGKDPILKERLFGLTNGEGNHGEDVKEYYFYLDSTPTHSYMKYLYKYPQAAYPYGDLIETNRRRGKQDFEYELLDTGVFDQDRYFDVFVEYAKAAPENLLIQITVENRGPEPATLHVLPTLWFRNVWSWGDDAPRPVLRQAPGIGGGVIAASHPDLGERFLYAEGTAPLLFTENETNHERLFRSPNRTPYVKDGIDRYIVHRREAVNPERHGSGAGATRPEGSSSSQPVTGGTDMHTPLYPSLYQINTRVWLTERSRALGRPATLDDIPDAELDRAAGMGFAWIWLLSVWRTGPAGQRVSRANGEWRREFEETLPDLRKEDIAGSGFAITGYTVHPDLGGDAALARLRERLRARGLRLMLDFVPNHTGLDHPWVDDHPEYYVAGTDVDLARAPQNYTWVKRTRGDLLLAHGRDPYFAGWPDTLQLDYGNPAAQEAMSGELLRIAGQCDGVRCDMAMLVLPDVFERTWGRRAPLFWPRATGRVRERVPGFCFMAEVYWDLEWTMLEQGFDYAYDKRLYDRLREGHARPVREHLWAGLDFQNKLARFLENHDEPRAAATFAPGMHEAAAVITYLSPGLRFFHQGQFEGRRKRISPHLVRAPLEPPDPALQPFYDGLLAVLRQPIVRDGQWGLLECAPAWDGNWTWECFIAWSWLAQDGQRRLVAVNYAGNQSQCYVRLPLPELSGRTVRLKDQMGAASYDRDGSDLVSRGLYLDLPPWGYHVFEVTAV